jgi:ABC-2 type transport system ATP-binding protein
MTDTVLETRGLTKYYGKDLALDHLDLKIPKGCICGFIGRNGAGKTTAIKIMLGLLNPTAGSASVLGCDCDELTPSIRQRIGYVTEGHRLIRWMTIAQLEKLQRSFYPKQWDRKLFADMIEYFQLSKKKKIKHLSNGQRAQVSLALTLAPNPEFLIMDDPTLGLDPAIRRQFLEGMIKLIMSENRTILFSSHILADVERVANRIIVLDKGVLRANCTLDEFRGEIKKFKFSYKDQATKSVEIDGLLNSRSLETELELTLVGTDQAKIERWAEYSGAENYQPVKMNLEDQFIEYTEPTGSKRLFQWETK